MLTFALIVFSVFLYVMIGGAIRGAENAFTRQDNKRLRSMDQSGFIADVLLWPIWLLILGGYGTLKLAEHSAKFAEERVQQIRDIELVAIPGVVEGEVEDKNSISSHLPKIQ